MIDLSKMSLAEVRALQEQLVQEVKKREQEEIAQARAQIEAIAKSVGLPLKDLLKDNKEDRTKMANVRAKGAVQYRHPANTALQWSGRGRKPQWVKEWLTAGNSLDALRV